MDYNTVKEAKRKIIFESKKDSVVISGREMECAMTLGIDAIGEFYVGLLFPASEVNIETLTSLFEIQDTLEITSTQLNQSGYFIEGIIAKQMYIDYKQGLINWDCMGLGDTKSFR